MKKLSFLILFIFSLNFSFAQYAADNDRSFTFPDSALPEDACFWGDCNAASCTDTNGDYAVKEYKYSNKTFSVSSYYTGDKTTGLEYNIVIYGAPDENINICHPVNTQPDVTAQTNYKTVSFVDYEAQNGTSFVVCQNETKNIKNELTYSIGVTYSGEGISSSGIFDASTVTPSNTYTVTATCVFDNGVSTVDFSIEVPAIGFTFDDVPNHCADGSTLDLQPYSNVSTTFSGTGVNGSFFDPLSAGVGTHPITAQYNNNGCLNTITKNIEVVSSFTIDAGANLEVCSNGSAINLNTNDAIPTGGTWSGTNISGGAFTPSGLTPGSYTAIYTYDNNGCTKSDSRLILVKSLPSVEAGNEIEFCPDEGVVSILGNSDPAGGVWNSPNGDVNSALNPTVGVVDLEALEPGTYTLEYSISQNGCTNTDTKNLIVRDIPTIPNVNDQERCDDGSVSLVFNTTDNFTVKWYDSEDDTEPIWTGSVFNTPTLVETTSYYVSLTNEFYCEGLKSEVVAIINPLPDVDAGESITFCTDAVDADLNQYVNLIPGTWSGPGVSSDGKFNSANLFIGTYTVVYTYTDPQTNCRNSDEKVIQVGLDPQIYADIEEIEIGDFVQFTSNLSNASEITWDFGDGFISNELNPLHYFYEKEIYDIQITFTLDNGCFGSYTAEQLIAVTGEIDIITRVGDELKDKFSLFPNPLKYTLYLDNPYDTPREVLIAVSTLSGKEVIRKHSTISIEDNIILTTDDISHLDPGIHLIQLQFDDFVTTLKILKR